MELRELRRERVRLQSLSVALGRQYDLGSGDVLAIRDLWRTARHHRSHSTIDPGSGPLIITSGWAAWVVTVAAGGRLPIALFLLPGDVIEAAVPGECWKAVSLTPVRTVDGSALLDKQKCAPDSALRGWIEGVRERQRRLLFAHLARLTSGGAKQRLAQLLMEFHERSQDHGSPMAERFELPIGQRVLAEALGCSLVQLNKVFAELKDDSLIDAGRGWLACRDLRRLANLAEHGPTRACESPEPPVPAWAHIPAEHAVEATAT